MGTPTGPGALGVDRPEGGQPPQPGSPYGGFRDARSLGTAHRTLAAADGDVLARYDPVRVAGWYGRLADLSERNGGVLAPATMRLWLKNRDATAKHIIKPHEHLQKSVVVKDALAYHRLVYLTEEKARLEGGSSKWAGVIPRLQGSGGYNKWDGKGTLPMHYQALAAYSKMQTVSFAFSRMPPAEGDVFASFHNFQLRTDVLVEVTTAGKQTTLVFNSFQAKAVDRYDWDPSKHLTMPNPDYGSKASWAIEPGADEIVVYHSNAKRLEKHGLAAPYDLETEAWTVSDGALVAPAAIDPSRRL